MTPSAYCSACGGKREGTKAFCTSCGAEHPVAPPAPIAAVPPAPAAPPAPRPAPTPRALRCVECSSPIDAGLVCARCAGRASGPVPAVATPPPAPSPPQPRTPVPNAPAPKAEETFGKRVLAVVLSIVVVILVGFMKVGIKAGVKGGLAAAPDVLSHLHGLDGTYVWQSAADASTWSRIRIDGERATVSDSTGWQDGGRVDRAGDTIRFENDITSSSRAAADPSKVDLGTLVQDGQAIEFDADGRTMRFVRQ